MLAYEIKTGYLYDFTNSAAFYMGKGFSGLPPHMNDPLSTSIPHVGPLPAAVYKIGKSYTHPELGPLCFDLVPILGTGWMYNRKLFRIHGANRDHPATSSHGCIVLEHDLRVGIDRGGDDTIVVIPVMPAMPAY